MLHVDKFLHGVRLLFLGMELCLSPNGISFCLGTHRRWKYVDLQQH